MLGRRIVNGRREHFAIIDVQASYDPRVLAAVPDRVAALDDRDVLEVVGGRRRTHRPLERVGAPRVVARDRALCTSCIDDVSR